MTENACQGPIPPCYIEVPYHALRVPQYANQEIRPMPTAQRIQPMVEAREKYQNLEKRIHAIKWFNSYGMDNM